MSRVHADDILSEIQHSLGFLVIGHDGAEVGHCFAVAFGICDCGEWVGTAVVLRDGDDVGPFV